MIKKQIFIRTVLFLSLFAATACISMPNDELAAKQVMGCYAEFGLFVTVKKILKDQIYLNEDLKGLIVQRQKETEKALKNTNPTLERISVLSINPIFRYSVRPKKFSILSISKNATSIVVRVKMQWDAYSKAKVGILNDLSINILLDRNCKISDIYFPLIKKGAGQVSLKDLIKQDIKILTE